MLAVLCLTNHRYGFHRDELATLDDARHLAWGYVAYPPVTPFFGWLSLQLFGTSLAGFRFFAAMAAAASAVLTGLTARELGGGRAAQLLSSALTIPFGLAAGSLMQYVALDYLAWILTAYFLVRLLRSDDPRWWVAIGGAVGLGMLTKYTMLFYVCGILVTFAVSGRWRDLKSRWLWLGATCAILIFLPNLLWQFKHDFISLDFLRHIHERDVRIGRTNDFLPDQLKLTLAAFPLAMAGLCYFLFSPEARRFRGLGWMFLVPLLLFVLAQGRAYYLAPAYALLYAGGSVFLERSVRRWGRPWSITTWSCVSLAVVANIVIAAAFCLPLAPINSAWWKKAAQTNDDLAEEIGWPELVETVAGIRDSMPPEERVGLGILVGNYGEGGAINLYGPAYGLPPAIGGVNSFWERGYGDPPPETVIVLGLTRASLEKVFQSCQTAGQIRNRYGVANEETKEHADIFICHGLRVSWPEFWKKFRHYG